MAGEQLTLKTGEASIILKKTRDHNQRHQHPSESIRELDLNGSEDPAELSGREAAKVLEMGRILFRPQRQ